MKQKLALLVFFFMGFAHGQNPPFDLKEKQTLISKLLQSNPDSARVHIRQVLSYGKLHDTIQSNAYLCYGYSCMLKNDIDSSLIFYNKALAYAKGYGSITARILRNKAAVHRKKAEYNTSLDILAQASEKYSALKDDKGLATVYGEMASNYNQMLKSDEAVKCLMKAIALLEKNNDAFYIYTVKQTLANTYMNAGNYTFAIDLYSEVLPHFKSLGSKNYYLTLINYGECQMQLKNYSAARTSQLEAIRGLQAFGDNTYIAVASSKLGLMSFEQRDFPEAEKYLEKAYAIGLAQESPQIVRIAADYLLVLNYYEKYTEAAEVIKAVEALPIARKANAADKMTFENLKAFTYQKLNDPDKTLASLKNKLELMDTLRENDNKAIATLQLQEQYQRKYQEEKNKDQQTINAALRDQVQESKMTGLVPLLSLTLIFAGLLMAYWYRAKQYRKKLYIAKNDQIAIQQEYEAHKKSNERQKKEMETTENELVHNIMAINTTEEHIKGLLDTCGNNPGAIDIDTIKAQLLSLTSDQDYWTLFRKRFNEAYTGFQDNLAEQFPQLTKNDLYFCTLLRLKLPYKDMAIFMQVTPESIVKKKYRVKKRMELASDRDLTQLLEAIPLQMGIIHTVVA